jgi:hypothetical protein
MARKSHLQSHLPADIGALVHERFDTADLKQAKALLEELSS